MSVSETRSSNPSDRPHATLLRLYSVYSDGHWLIGTASGGVIRRRMAARANSRLTHTG
ncbi:hypothetical protein DF3PA_240021 [Candidatus Defluviicoccus seviourii]|uniref:Uncharacterized protein n=1 Tax=Candidatus Defluviicoccus seviourii TaxID=2565273 RepID=A0A564WDM9_9PROT|nr:hypothetical protein DF3PA_240021 [Candidatus Defluviicoccus seviourii]